MRQTIYLGNQRALTTTERGHLMYLQTTDLSLAPWIMLRGVWEEACTEIFCELVRPRLTVVEIGANVGYFTLLAADRVGSDGCVHAFEPDPQNFELLRDNVEVNGFSGRVRLHREALCDRPRIATFYGTLKHRGNGSLIERLDQLGDNSGEVVPFDVDVATLDAFEFGEVDVFKIDAEGSEGASQGFLLARIAGRKDARVVPESVDGLTAMGMTAMGMTELVLRKGVTWT